MTNTISHHHSSTVWGRPSLIRPKLAHSLLKSLENMLAGSKGHHNNKIMVSRRKASSNTVVIISLMLTSQTEELV